MAETKREHDRVFQMRVSDTFLSILDEWRRGQPDLPSRAEAVRRLVERGANDSTTDRGAYVYDPETDAYYRRSDANCIGHRDDPEGAN